MPAPQGFATGGQVTQLKIDNNQPIAASDTIPAMLTPGEFVINSRDAQKNLPLLEHINKGGKREDILPGSQAPNVQQTEETNSLTSSSLGLDIAKQRSSFTNNQSLNYSQNKSDNIVQKNLPSNNYLSPPLIFKKANNYTYSNIDFDTPSQWSTVEELMNIVNDDRKFTNLNSENYNLSNPKSFHASQSPSHSQNFVTKSHHSPKGFAKGGEVKKDDISTEIKPITKTINNMSSNSKENDEIALEALAREIYTRLRQQLEIEKERQGSYLGRLPW